MSAAATDAAVAGLRERGYHITPAAIPPALCAEVIAEIHRMEQQRVPLSLRNPFNGFHTLRFHDLLNHGEVWQRLAIHPAILGVARGLLGDDCLLNTYGTSIIAPGESEQPVHVDDGPFIGAFRDGGSGLRARPFLEEEGGRRKPLVCSCMVALSSFSAENGATVRPLPSPASCRHLLRERVGCLQIMVPGSHRENYPRPKDDALWRAKSIPMVAGSGEPDRLQTTVSSRSAALSHRWLRRLRLRCCRVSRVLGGRHVSWRGSERHGRAEVCRAGGLFCGVPPHPGEFHGECRRGEGGDVP